MMIGDYQKRCQQRVDGCLETLFVPPLPQLERLYQAMRYSVMNGGKRVRPALIMPRPPPSLPASWPNAASAFFMASP